MKFSQIMDQRKLSLAMIGAVSDFWAPVAVAYHIDRGATLSQVFHLFAFYYICVVLFEYPTGVLGDRIGYKKSLLIGYVTLALAFFLLSLPGSNLYYAVCLAVSALGRTFYSGSDIALFHHLSSNFKEEYRRVQVWKNNWNMIAIAFGGIIGATFGLHYTFLLASLSFCISAVAVALIKTRPTIGQTEKLNNIFHQAKNGLQFIYNTKPLLLLTAMGCITIGLLSSIKWYYNPIFELVNIPLEYWGFIVAGFSLIRNAGIILLKRTTIAWHLIGIVIALFVAAQVHVAALVIVGLIGLNLFYGSLETVLTTLVNTYATDTNRAGTHSFQNLIQKLFSSVYLGMVGVLTSYVGIDRTLYFTLGLLLLSFAVIAIYGWRVQQYKLLRTFLLNR